MDYLNAIIFGIIQGITEFLPVSSSGHLVVLHEFINIPIGDELIFDVILHLATLFAVIYFFRKDIVKLIKSWVKSFSGKVDNNGRLSWFIILATIPAALAGFFAEDVIENVFRDAGVVVAMLIIVGLLFVVIEKISKKLEDLDSLNWKKSLVIGLAQAVSLIPGTSRSGITIIAGLGYGLKREAAIKFSFLLSIPIIAGASIKKIPDILGITLSSNELSILIIAFCAAFVTGILAIRFFLQFAQKFSLNSFAYYRFLLAILVYFLLVW